MTKFSAEIRMYVISLLKKGNSMHHVSRVTGIHRRSIRQWWYHYLQGGIAQVLHTNRAYTPEFKQYVLETKWQNGLSLTQTATRFQIPAGGIIWQWEQAVLTQGWAGLQPKRKGRPPIMAKKKSTPQKPLTQIQALGAENAQLRMENAFLKKLNALVQAREKKNTPKSSPN